jgi:anti-anti-sigma factor
MDTGEPYFHLDIDADASPVTIAARGELDAASSQELSDALNGAAGRGVSLDLAEVSFIDSSGLRVITAAMREAKEAGNGFQVAAASDAVRRIFEMTGLNSLLDA